MNFMVSSQAVLDLIFVKEVSIAKKYSILDLGHYALHRLSFKYEIFLEK
jgi:hypothetical protein